MGWLRVGDTLPTSPIVNKIADRETLLKVVGLVILCAASAAAWDTDYRIERGLVTMFGGDEADQLAEIARKAGWWKKVRGGWELVADPKLIHMRLKKEIEWESQRRADSSNLALTVPVRARDGDACRYCGAVVYFNDRRSRKSGSYDHRSAGDAGTVATIVVACRECNSGRKDDPGADERYPLLPVPNDPYYAEPTKAWLRRNRKHLTDLPSFMQPMEDRAPSTVTELRPRTQRDTAQATPEPRGQRDTTPVSTGNQQVTAETVAVGTGFAGSGRVGAAPGSARSSSRRRSKRGKGGA